MAFRFIAANEHPDHDTIATFRRRFLKQIEALFVQVLGVAREMGVLKLGTVALDGTKIHANASRHSALSHQHASQIEAQLQAEVADLLGKAEAADQAEIMVVRYITSPTAWFLCAGPGDWKGGGDANSLVVGYKWQNRVKAWYDNQTGNYGIRTSYRNTYGFVNWRGIVASQGS